MLGKFNGDKMAGWLDGWMAGQTDRQINRRTDIEEWSIGRGLHSWSACSLKYASVTLLY